MYKLFSRMCGFLDRFFVACNNFGFLNTLHLFFGLYVSSSVQKVHMKSIGRDIYFRGKSDRVMCHFFRELYHIKHTQNYTDIKIIDAGAHIGDETIRFRHFHPNAEIIAIEAEERNFQILVSNFSTENNTFLYNRALWSEKTSLTLSQASNSNQSYITTPSRSNTDNATATIETITIDYLLKKHQWDQIDILKLDIEGAEKKIFSCNISGWINKVNVFIFELPDHSAPYSTQIIFNALNGMKFNSYLCDESLILIKKDAPYKLHTSKYY